jgi:hypothetical protein
LKGLGGIPDMALVFDVEDGWLLECDDCMVTEFSGRWEPASVIISELEKYGWRFDEYGRFDGFVLADAECAACGGREQ